MMYMYIVVVLAGLITLYFVVEVCLGIIRAMTKPKVAPLPAREGREIVLRRLWLEVEPAPFKVIVFADGKYEGRLVMHGPHNGVVTRLLLLWKADKHRSIKLNALCGIGTDSIDEAYRASFDEAKKIARAVYGKKQHAVTAPNKEYAAPQPMAAEQPVPVVVAEHKPAAVPEQIEVPKEREAPVIKGFIAQYVGSVASFGVHKHPTQGYEIFTLTLNTANGPEHISGVDVRRAMDAAGVQEGDRIRAIYLKDKQLPGGRTKKLYEIVKLAAKPA